MLAEVTEISFITDRAINPEYAKKLRGFFGNYYRNRFEFHQHIGKSLLYRHPLIQYKAIDGTAILTGINEGAFLLRIIDQFKELRLGRESYRIVRQTTTTRKVDIGISTNDESKYSFLSPWLALNENNYKEYQKICNSPDEIRSLLSRVLIGNLLSFSKSVGYSVDEQIEVDFTLDGTELVTAKNDTTMFGFKGSFRSNFNLPDLWGIGKLSSMGFGVVKRNT